jgi:hypothetical protein
LPGYPNDTEREVKPCAWLERAGVSKEAVLRDVAGNREAQHRCSQKSRKSVGRDPGRTQTGTAKGTNLRYENVASQSEEGMSGFCFITTRVCSGAKSAGAGRIFLAGAGPLLVELLGCMKSGAASAAVLPRSSHPG